jgi:two-component system response regulator DevR
MATDPTPPNDADRPTAVLLATRSELLGLGFGRLLGASPDLHLVGRLDTVDGLCRAVVERRATLAVVDVHLDGEGGLAVNRRLAELPTRTRHCFLVDDIDARTVARLTRGGANGLIHTTATAAQSHEALRCAAGGEGLVMDPVLAHAVARDVLVDPGPPRHVELSDRERELLDLLGDGRTNREIAAALYLSEKTIRNCLSVLFRKLGVRSRTEAALLATGATRAA